ncbi:hypothetical protein KIL84_006643 [Mauremys mutica]|uniref:Uncharacterized protein n=1 Tax=Mauremys mutica TaxID=74926 RepID=A0A9D3X1L4_9SAUR|nr:hypothetical protein KIL84_006643 [Mauremys mutica]
MGAWVLAHHDRVWETKLVATTAGWSTPLGATQSPCHLLHLQPSFPGYPECHPSCCDRAARSCPAISTGASAHMYTLPFTSLAALQFSKTQIPAHASLGWVTQLRGYPLLGHKWACLREESCWQP